MAGHGKTIAAALLVLNFCMYLIVTSIGGLATSIAINQGFYIGLGLSFPPHFSPIYFPEGNAATGFMVIFTVIAGMVGVASSLSGIHHIRSWNSDSLPSAAASAVIAWSLTLLSMSFAWKEVHLQERTSIMRTIEVFAILLSITQLLYILAIHTVPSNAARIGRM